MSIRDTELGDKPDTWLGDDGIVYHDLSGISHLSATLMKFLLNQRIAITGRKSVPVIMLAENVLTVDFEVQILASNPQVLNVTRAIGIVGNSFMLRHLTSMFLSYHAPVYPVARFDTREEAKDWLLDYCQQAAE
jgi:hypothetical protein